MQRRPCGAVFVSVPLHRHGVTATRADTFDGRTAFREIMNGRAGVGAVRALGSSIERVIKVRLPLMPGAMDGRPVQGGQGAAAVAVVKYRSVGEGRKTQEQRAQFGV